MKPIMYCPYYDAQEGQEIQVRYPENGHLPHRGIIYRIRWIGLKRIVTVAHNSKVGKGVRYTTLEEFAEGLPVEILRSADSPQHLADMKRRIEAAKAAGIAYGVLFSNCEHFSTWVYSGQADSPTLKILLGLLLAIGVFGYLFFDEQSKPSRRRY